MTEKTILTPGSKIFRKRPTEGINTKGMFSAYRLIATPGRLAVYDLLQRSLVPLTVAEIIEIINATHPFKITPSTTHRMIREFTNFGIAQKTIAGKGDEKPEEIAYERAERYSYHITCRSCKKVETLLGEWFEKSTETLLRRSKNFHRIEKYVVECTGICNMCYSKTAP